MSRSAEGGRVEVAGLTWRPAGRRSPVLSDLDLTVEPGQRVLLTGPSGAGKSTLLRALAGLLLSADVGDLEGRVTVGGGDPRLAPGRVAMLLQDPTAAVVSERVGRDVAFGLENLRVPSAQIWTRVHAALEGVGFPYDVRHPTSALSGGELQRLALAGALVLGPQLLLLDEPTSMLDAEAATQVRRGVLDAVERTGATVVVVEHHIAPWVPEVDRLLVLGRDGRIDADGDPQRLLSEHGRRLADDGVWVPGWRDPAPMSVPAEMVQPWDDVKPGEPLVTADAVTVRYRQRPLGARCDSDGSSLAALTDVGARLQPGRALAVTGPSGSGKSTLVSVLAGLRRPDGGSVRAATSISPGAQRQPWAWRSRTLAARLAWVPQHPEYGVVGSQVRDEVLAAARAVGRDPSRAEHRADALLEVVGLSRLAQSSPYHLSAGEQRRLVVAAALAHGPFGVLLDEPTVGQDRATWAAVAGLCAAARDAGTAVAASGHDRALGDAVADDRLTLRAGRTG